MMLAYQLSFAIMKVDSGPGVQRVDSPSDPAVVDNAKTVAPSQLTKPRQLSNAPTKALSGLTASSSTFKAGGAASKTGKGPTFSDLVTKADHYNIHPLNGTKTDSIRPEQSAWNQRFVEDLKQRYPNLSVNVTPESSNIGAVLSLSKKNIDADTPATLYVSAAQASQTIRSNDVFANSVPVSFTLPEGRKIGHHNNARAMLEGAIVNGSHGKAAQYDPRQAVPEHHLDVRGYHRKVGFEDMVNSMAKSLAKAETNNKQSSIFAIPMPGSGPLLSGVVDHFSKNADVKHVVFHANRVPNEAQMKELHDKIQIPGARTAAKIVGTVVASPIVGFFAANSQNNAPDSDFSKTDTFVRGIELAKTAAESLSTRRIKYEATGADPQFDE